MTVIELKESGKIYFSVKYGKMVGYVDPQDPRYSEKTVKDGDGNDKVISGYFISGLKGFITGMEIVKKDTTGGKWTELHVTFDGEHILILKSTMINDFIATIASADFLKEVRVSPYTNKKGFTRLWITQSSDGKTPLAHHFYDFDTKIQINGHPIPEFDSWATAEDSEKTIFKAKSEKFLRDYMNETIVPKLPKAKTIAEVNAENDLASQESIEAAFAEDINPEDIPF